ncbi:chitooligosaccharidolytic beta-N-acetylglucosaminidase [Cylas formicarius]|uniref:chitooligosaccharidolytic beta-N-acetylglucosaminidase n=1 Tax=Cylas formicarius TaxID=197179 RepID=UPI002958B863|nr:chitooligosaccharidolytic beta-N-acetylglucosaminidase [Cylas formicarius]
MNFSICQWMILPFLIHQGASWVWKCQSETRTCKRQLQEDSEEIDSYASIELCRLVCGSDGIVWPKPKVYEPYSKKLINIDVANADFFITNNDASVQDYLTHAIYYFKNHYDSGTSCRNASSFSVILKSENNSLNMGWDTSEEYSLLITTTSELKVIVSIVGDTVYGVRHALESLLQMIATYQRDTDICHATIQNCSIVDGPVYSHRGLLIDTARNFLSIDTIKRNIRGMAMSKMNVLHWHMTDSQSFPFESSRLPNMTRYGAYSSSQVYKPADLASLIEFAKNHGVKIIPEIDGPSHAGSGWQWGPDAGFGNLVVCYQQQPWRSYCVQPPCGQMNPANPKLYDVLGLLYNDIVDLWPESDVFHMGGDEVFIPCWNSTEEILKYIEPKSRSNETFLDLWAEFQSKSLSVYDAKVGNEETSIVVWTSHLTDPAVIEKYLSKDRYVIQAWVPADDPLPTQLLKLGYKLIISTKDKWYLDHGSWGTTKFSTWKDVYDNKIPLSVNVFGGEVCMWGEYVDDDNMEGRVWPKAAAAAERLWSNPATAATAAANRFYIQRKRLVDGGIKAAAVIPKFCEQNEAECD